MEPRLRALFQDIGPVWHAVNILQQVRAGMGLLRRYPDIVAAEVHRFSYYLRDARPDNVGPALIALLEISRAVPGSRSAIAQALGVDLLRLKSEDLVAPNERARLDELVASLQLADIPGDDSLKALARGLAVLGQPMLIVAGAGLSYDTMPVTHELSPLLIQVLRDCGIDNPVNLLRDDEQRAWGIVKNHADLFKQRFAGWSARSHYTEAHRAIATLLREGRVEHVVSFNWDDLVERAYRESFGEDIEKVTREGMAPRGPAIWKLHGDVTHLDEPWIFPFDQGRVFDSLMQCLEEHVPSMALVVGYSESEPLVRTRMMGWLETNVVSIVRVRPNLEDGILGARLTATEAFRRLRVYMDMARQSDS